MMRSFAISLFAAASMIGAVHAEDFSEGSQAKSWNLVGQENALFEAKVVDIHCELTGDCAENCGDGRRQLGLIRSADNALLIVNKNVQPIFTGGVEDLLPYCNEMVEVDGLMVGEGVPTKFYQVQLIRRVGEEEWNRTTRFTESWNEANPDLKDVKGPWFRKDPSITSRIEKNGYLGLGLETDAAFIEEEFGG